MQIKKRIFVLTGRLENVGISERRIMVNKLQSDSLSQYLGEKINHPNHYQGSCAESWDLTVLEWGPEYAIAAWVIQAQQYYDRHKEKNGTEDLDKAMEFIHHAEDVYKFYSESSNVIVDMDPYDFWQRVDFLKKMIEKACKDAAKEPKKETEADDRFSSMMSKCDRWNGSWFEG